MSSSSDFSRFSGHQQVKSSEKSTFFQTCSLLSQYLKEKGSFRDLGLGMKCNIETNGSPETPCHSATTLELFPTNVTPQRQTTKDFLNPRAAYPQHTEVPALVNSSELKSMGKEPKAAQLTIVYAGKVMVFDDFPADKVEEMMSLASKGNPQSQNSPAYAHTQSQPSIIPNLMPQGPSRPIVCDPPIARKASLHRFLEKRKDRISAKAPYQTSNSISATNNNKQAESISWLGLGAKSTQI